MPTWSLTAAFWAVTTCHKSCPHAGTGSSGQPAGATQGSGQPVAGAVQDPDGITVVKVMQSVEDPNIERVQVGCSAV